MALVIQPLDTPVTMTPAVGSTFYSYDIEGVPTNTKAIVVRITSSVNAAYQFGLFHPDATTRTRYYSGNYVGQWLFMTAASVTGTTATIIANRDSSYLTLYATHYIAGDIELFTQPYFMTVPTGYTSWNSFNVTDAGVPSNAAYALITINAITNSSVVGLRPVDQTTWDSRVTVANSAGSFMVPLDGSGNFGLVAPQNAVIAVLGYLMPEQGLAYTPSYVNNASTGWQSSGSGRSLWFTSASGGSTTNYATGWRRSGADTSTQPFSFTYPARGGFWQQYMTSTEHQAYFGNVAVDIYAWGGFRIQGAGTALGAAQAQGTATVPVPPVYAVGTASPTTTLAGNALVINSAASTIATHAAALATPSGSAQGGATIAGQAAVDALGTIARLGTAVSTALATITAQANAINSAIGQVQVAALGTGSALVINPAVATVAAQASLAATALGTTSASTTITTQAMGAAATSVIRSVVANTQAQALTDALGQAVKLAQAQALTAATAQAQAQGLTGAEAIAATAALVQADAALILAGAAIIAAQGQAQGVPARTVPAAVDVMAEAALMGSGYIPGQGAYAHIGLVATLAATAEAQVGLSLGPGRLTRYTRAGVMPIKRAGLKRPL